MKALRFLSSEQSAHAVRRESSLSLISPPLSLFPDPISLAVTLLVLYLGGELAVTRPPDR